ncbi:MAG: hypothetical protein V3V20_01320 [Algisphaera sp.]
MTLLISLLAQAPTPILVTPPVGGTGDWMVYGLVLLALAVVLFFIEAFLPTGGVLGVVSGLFAVAGVVCFFQINTTAGALSAAAVLFATPVLLVLGVKIWPDTPFGQWVTHRDQQERLAGPNAAPSEAGGHTPINPGDTGEAVTDLRPVGICVIHGRRRECYARSGSLPQGVGVEVVSISGNEVYVREKEECSE